MDRIAASILGGVASPTRTPPMNLASGAVLVARAVLRASALRVPKDVLQDRAVKGFTVYPDDTVEPVNVD
jgi:hypothetical protein